MAALDMDGQSETNKSPASTQHAGLFLEGASSPSHKKRHCLSAMSSLGAQTDSDFFTKISRNFKTFQITEYQQFKSKSDL